MEATTVRRKKGETKPGRAQHDAAPDSASGPAAAPGPGLPLFLRRAAADSAPVSDPGGEISIGPAGDAFEQEAESVADAVVAQAPEVGRSAAMPAALDVAAVAPILAPVAPVRPGGPAAPVAAAPVAAPARTVPAVAVAPATPARPAKPAIVVAPAAAPVRTAAPVAVAPAAAKATPAAPAAAAPKPAPAPAAKAAPAAAPKPAPPPAPKPAPAPAPKTAPAPAPKTTPTAAAPASPAAAPAPSPAPAPPTPAPPARPATPSIVPAPPEPAAPAIALVPVRGTDEVMAVEVVEPEAGRDAAAEMAASIAQPATPGEMLAESVRGVLEWLLSADLSGIRVHKDPADRESARAVHARAFTVGNDIWLGPGESENDLRLLAHEVVHVLQGDPQLRRAPAAGAAPAPPKKKKPAPGQAPAGQAPGATAGGATPGAAPSAAPAPASGGGGEAAPVQLQMPEPPSDVSPETRARIEGVQEQAGAAAEANADMPPADQVTEGTRAAVAEPAAEAAGRAQGDVVEGLDQKVAPSPEIEALCTKIYAVIKAKRPPDEDKLVEAKPEDMANQAGGELDANVSGDTQRVQGGYDEMGQTPAGQPAPAEQSLETPPAAAETPAVNATAATPDPVPAENVSLQADVESSAAQMDEAGMNTEPAELVQSGPIAEARAAQGELATRAAEDPARIIAQQEEARGKAGADMAALQAKALAALRGARGETAGGVGQQQGAMVQQEAVTRENVGTQAQAIFTRAQADVRALLQPLPTTAMERWNTEKAVLSRQFKASLAEVKKWIDERHSGIGGAILAGGDYLFGLPQWVTDAYNRAEEEFGHGVCRVIREISIEVNRVILACEGIIEQANKDIKAKYDALGPELAEWAAQEQARFAEQLDGLRNEAHKARDDFNKDLVQRAGQAVQEVREEIHALRQAAGGLLGKVMDAIGRFIEDPAKFIIEGLLELVGIPPAAFWAVVARISQVINDIADNPLGFANNLAAGLAQGFSQFFDNIGSHLVSGFFDWLFSGLGSVGVQLPPDFSPRSIITFALQLMGITWAKIRKILARHIGEKNVALLEKAYEIVSMLMEKGPEGIFEMIKEKLDPKQIIDQIIQAGIQFLVEALIKTVSVRIIAMMNPAGALIQALEAIYRILKWVFENAARIFALVETVVNGMAQVIAGNIGGMATAVEGALARLIAPVIDFLAGYMGLGDLPIKIADVIKGFQGWIEGILESVIGFLAEKAKSLLASLGIGGKDKPGGAQEGDGEIGESVSFSGGGEGHRMWVQTSGTDATLMVASVPEDAQKKIAQWNGKVGTLPVKGPGGAQPRKEAKALLGEAGTLADQANKDADALARLIAKHASPASDAAGGKDGGKSEVDTKDDALEARERALAVVMGKLFDLFGGGGVVFAAITEEAKWAGGSATVALEEAGSGVRLTVGGTEGLGALAELLTGDLAKGVSKSGYSAVEAGIAAAEPQLAIIKEVVLVDHKLEATLLEDLQKGAKTIAKAVAGVGKVLGVAQLSDAKTKKKMDEVKPSPAFSYPPTGSKEYKRVYTTELKRQLERQQTGLNALTVDAWAANVNAFRMVEDDFNALDSAGRAAVLERLKARAQEAYDGANRVKKGKYTRAINAINDALAVDGVAVPDLARLEIVIARFGDETTPWRKKHYDGIREMYKRAKAADKRFADICSATYKFVVLHNPDQIAGGPEDLKDPPIPPAGDADAAEWEKYLKQLEPLLGARRVNSAIGRQWRDRIGNLYAAITKAKKEPTWPLWELNVNLLEIQQRSK